MSMKRRRCRSSCARRSRNWAAYNRAALSSTSGSGFSSSSPSPSAASSACSEATLQTASDAAASSLGASSFTASRQLAAGYSTSLPLLLVFRCTTMLGVCVEFVAAVAWLAELFPNPSRRESVLGYTQASAAIGGAVVTLAFLLGGGVRGGLPPVRRGRAGGG